MYQKKPIVFIALIGALVIGALYLLSTTRENNASRSPADNVASSDGPTETDTKKEGAMTSLGAHANAQDALLMDFDVFMSRVVTGDDSLSPGERAGMTARLEYAVMNSPAQRALLKKRMRAAFLEGDYITLMELERGFNTSSVGVADLLEVYSEEISRAGPLDYYAMQNAAFFPGALSDKNKISIMEKAFDQISNRSDFGKYSGAMNYLSSVLRDPDAKIPSGYRENAIRVIQNRLDQATTYDEQYFTAQNLFKLFPAQDAAMEAARILRQRPTFPFAQATLDAIINGRMSSDARLLQLLRNVASSPGMNQNDARKLQELLARIQSNQRVVG